MEFIPGKRYRWTTEGVADRNGIVHLSSGQWLIHPEMGQEGSFELLPDPLPTTPGSVVRDPSGDVYQLQPAGHWTSPGELTTYSRDYMSGFTEHLTVLFDAGAER